MELIGLLGIIVMAGLCALVLSVVLLPFVLLLKLIGFGFRLTFGAIGMVLGGLILLPLAAIVGGLILFKLLVLATPLLILVAVVGTLVMISRRQAAAA